MRHKNPELLDGISSYMGEVLLSEGRVPSNSEVGLHFKISKSCAQKYMATIAKQHLCKQLDKYNNEYSKTMVVDTGLSCGAPTYEEESITEYTRLPASVFGDGEKIITHANGDSMIDVGIDDGDTLVLSTQKEAKDGEIILATLDGASTLKTLKHHSDGRPYLHPENKSMSDIEIHEGTSFIIQGVLAYVIKNFRGFRSI